MKELNERQKADHASRMYEQIKSSVDSVETRNAELEQKFAEVRLFCGVRFRRRFDRRT